MSRWIGRWIVAVSAIHTIFGVTVFRAVLAEIARAGIWNSIGEGPMRAAVAWFLLSGFFMAVLGLTVDTIEQSGQQRPLRAAGIGLFLTIIVGIVLMPASGFWLLLPPALAMIGRRGSMGRLRD
jgi:hypothetical protein